MGCLATPTPRWHLGLLRAALTSSPQGPAWYDFTTNYCNLRNLMVGAGLAQLQGYRWVVRGAGPVTEV